MSSMNFRFLDWCGWNWISVCTVSEVLSKQVLLLLRSMCVHLSTPASDFFWDEFGMMHLSQMRCWDFFGMTCFRAWRDEAGMMWAGFGIKLGCLSVSQFDPEFFISVRARRKEHSWGGDHPLSRNRGGLMLMVHKSTPTWRSVYPRIRILKRCC